MVTTSRTTSRSQSIGRSLRWASAERLACLCVMSIGLALCVEPAPAGTRLEASVVDDATGEPSAARIAITDAQGKFVEIEGKHEHVQYLDKRWCYIDGSFALAIPADGASIEVRRGF